MVSYYDETQTHIKREYISLSTNTFTTPADTKYIRISFYYFKDSDNNPVTIDLENISNYVYDIQLEEGTEISDYTDYITQNSDNLASTIESIDTGKWKPQKDWWDIDSILESDTEDYPAKMIYLLNDFKDTTNFVINTTNKIAKIKTSDGAEYTETAEHTWDKTKDKTCSFEYKTRYVIVYFCDENVYMTSLNISGFYNNAFIQEIDSTAIYVIWKNLRINYNQTGSRSFFYNYWSLEYVKQINSYFSITNQGYIFYGCYNLIGTNLKFENATAGYYRFMQCRNLREIEHIDYSNYISAGYMFGACVSLKRIGNINMPLLTVNTKIFENCNSLEEIGSIDFSNATSGWSTFNGCNNLKIIKKITGLNISGYDFSACCLLSHDTLIRILNALADYSADTENTYTITLGTVNLAKLTEDEIAIGTNKGWTVS